MDAAIFQPPQPDALDHEVLALIAELRERLRLRVADPRRWTASLRRSSPAS